MRISFLSFISFLCEEIFVWLIVHAGPSRENFDSICLFSVKLNTKKKKKRRRNKFNWKINRVCCVRVLQAAQIMNLDISRTTLGIAAGIAGTLFLSYCIYFDKKRRNDPEYKRKVRESKCYLRLNATWCMCRKLCNFHFVCKLRPAVYVLLCVRRKLIFCFSRFPSVSTGRRKCRQRKIGNSGSRTELPNLNDHEAVQR